MHEAAIKILEREVKWMTRLYGTPSTSSLTSDQKECARRIKEIENTISELERMDDIHQPSLSKKSKRFMEDLFKNQQDLPNDIVEAVNEHFWELL